MVKVDKPLVDVRCPNDNALLGRVSFTEGNNRVQFKCGKCGCVVSMDARTFRDDRQAIEHEIVPDQGSVGGCPEGVDRDIWNRYQRGEYHVVPSVIERAMRHKNVR